ncbi:pentatricopeptide repeat-containing protein At2g39620 [Cynara cardunculus var. scolymus]|uniref:pentatricopeptide repeat-containing protein At2g39620 n=1 Tax=Cynara cardunculus var. scolymus TaxID=59895 RepID=UPI000D629175|nr:pentatricopeptide repeat-containing protein At2g39620 [Cynara cardunculus var. scolymus]
MKRRHLFLRFSHNHPLPRSLDFLFKTFSNLSLQLPTTNYHPHHHLISLISTSKTLKHLLQIHTQLVISGFIQDNITNTHLIESYSLFKKINLARLVFNATSNPSVILWNSIIKAHIRSNQHQEAILMYNKLLNTDSFAGQPDKYTYTFVLKACTHLLDIEDGILLHEEIVNRGLESDVFIGTGLVDMYCKCGDLVHARQVFDKIPNKDVVVWNAMIAGLSHSSDFAQAVEVFRSMQLQGEVEPNSVSLLNLFPAICKLSSVRLCKCIHGFVIRRNFPKAIVNGLIDVYCKCKSTDLAYRVFELMQEPDDVSWGTLMAGFALNGCHYEVLELYDQMKNSHLKVNVVSVVSALSAAGETRDLKKGKMIHECVKKNKFDSDIRVSTPLITMYAKCGELEKARDLFHRLSGKDMVAWSAVIAAFAQSGYPEEALSLFRDMQYASFKPSMITIVGVLPACAELFSKKLGKSLHCYAVKHNMDSDISIETSLVAMYAKSDDFTSAELVFYRMFYKEVVAWNALINRYAQIGEADLAFKMFSRLQSSDVQPDPGTLVGVVSAAAHLGDLNLGGSIHGLVTKYGFESDCNVNNALIDMYAKSQSLASAELLFCLTKRRDQVLWNVMIGAYMRHGYGQESIFTFRQMKTEDFRPSLVTLVSVLPAAAYLAAIKEGSALHADIIQTGYLSHTAVCNSLIDMYSKCGRVDYAETVFNEINVKDTVSWNVMLAGYALNGRGDHAFGFFSIMQENLVEIDPVSFVSVLSACRHAGLVEEGKNVFSSMKVKHHMEPKLEHYACMVDLLGRAGLFDETLALIESMPMEADAGVWGGLLGACQMHCNVKVAELALDNLVKLEPGNQAHYVVLSSIYAESGRWADARSLRTKMIDMGLKKTPGYSWINEKQDLHLVEG